jgi:hypothetical protein
MAPSTAQENSLPKLAVVTVPGVSAYSREFTPSRAASSR